MATTEPQIPTAIQLLDAYRGRAKKSLGQNFLIDPNVIARIAVTIAPKPQTPVLEIGPGPGSLTQALARRHARILAVEKDTGVVEHLQRELVPVCTEAGVALEVIEDDILQFELPETPERWVVAGNLPYNISTQVFFHFIDVRHRIEHLVFMFQKEVAERFVASPSTSSYGVLSLVGQLYFDMRIALHVPPEAFRPRPKVHSAIVVFVPRSEAPDVDPKKFRQVVKQAFSQRRKTLPNALNGIFGCPKATVAEVMQGLGLDPRRRAESLDLDTFCALTRALQKASV